MGHTEALDFSPDGASLAVGGWSLGYVYSVETGKELGFLETSSVHHQAYSADSRQIAIADASGLKIWDGKLNEVEADFPRREVGEPFEPLPSGNENRHRDHVQAMAFHDEGRRLVTTDCLDVRCWKLPEGTFEKHYKLQDRWSGDESEERIRQIAIAPTKKVLLTFTPVRLESRELLTGKLRKSIEHELGQVWGMCVSPDEKYVALGCDDGVIRLYDPSTLKLVRELNGHKSGVFTCSFTRDGREMASISPEDGVRVWDVERGACISHIKKATGGAVALSLDGRYLAAPGYDTRIHVWKRVMQR